MKTDAPLLFLFCSPPLAGSGMAAGLDLLLTAASFDQPVSVVFAGVGVQGLLAQKSASVSARNPALALGALDLYGIDEVCASRDDIERYNVDITLPGITVKALEDAEIQALVRQASQVMVY